MGIRKVRATFHAGPYFAFLQSADYSNRTFKIIRDVNNNFIEVAEEEAFRINTTSRNANTGVLIKVGAEMKASEFITTFIQASYSRSFSQADDFSAIRSNFPDAVESGSRFSSFGISVGVYFRMN